MARKCKNTRKGKEKQKNERGVPEAKTTAYSYSLITESLRVMKRIIFLGYKVLFSLLEPSSGLYGLLIRFVKTQLFILYNLIAWIKEIAVYEDAKSEKREETFYELLRVRLSNKECEQHERQVHKTNMQIVVYVLLLSVLRMAIVFLFVLLGVSIRAFDESTNFLGINKLLAPLIRWDAIYFHQISKNGYEQEDQYAFFPLYPMITQVIGRLVHSYALGGVILSNSCMFLSGILFYKLTMNLSQDTPFTNTATVLYCLTPAAGYYSSLYSEPLFGFLFIVGLYLYQLRSRVCILFYMLCSYTRSNGILISPAYVLCEVQRTNILSLKNGSIKVAKPTKQKVYTLLKILTEALAITLPFFYIQYTCFLKFKPFGRPWCSGWFPSIYKFVQEHYWDNGFLKYYTLNNLALIVLSSITIYIYLKGILCYVRGGNCLFFSVLNLPLVCMWAVQTVMLLTQIHMHIVLRFTLYNPVIYWYLAHTQMHKRSWIVPYLLSYGIVNLLSFTCFYPPA